MKKTQIMAVNLAAGLIAGAILGMGEIVIQEIQVRGRAKALVNDVTEAKPVSDGPE